MGYVCSHNELVTESWPCDECAKDALRLEIERQADENADLRRRLARSLRALKAEANCGVHDGIPNRFWESETLVDERAELRARRAKGRKS